MNQNDVILLDYAGGYMHACVSAWQSTGLDLGIDLKSLPVKSRIAAIFNATASKKAKTPRELIKMLMREGHHTPFEKSYIHFSVTAEIASHIHCLKHRIGVAINCESARYKEMQDDKFYIPADFSLSDQERLRDHVLKSFELYHSLINSHTAHLQAQGMGANDARKRAKESARFALTYATQLNFDVAFNMRSFLHFISLRKSPKAQLEIREIADAMWTAVYHETDSVFKMILEAF